MCRTVMIGIVLSLVGLLQNLPATARADGLHTYVLDMRFRQLALDDRVPFRTHNVEKVFPTAQDLGRPVLEASYPYEKYLKVLSEPHVAYDAERQVFQMWYWSWYRDVELKKEFTPLCYAESSDGLVWTKPELGLVEHRSDGAKNNLITNDLWTPTILRLPAGHEYRVLFHDGHVARAAVFSKDGRSIDAKKPFRMLDIPNVREMEAAIGRWISDGYRLMHDPLTNKYRLAIKSWAPLAGSAVPGQWRRTIALAESNDAVNWQFQERMVECDLVDDAFIAEYSAPTRKQPELPAWAEIEQMSFFRYEGLILGFANLIHFYDNYLGGNESTSHLWWTADGKNWSKPRVRKPFFNYPHGTPYWGFSKGMGPMPPLRKGNELWFFRDVAEGQGNERLPTTQQWFTLAKLREDAWAGYFAGPGGGWLETQEFIASGEELRINADCTTDGAALAVEVFEIEGPRFYPAHLFKNTPVAGFLKDDCRPLQGDAFRTAVQWKSRKWQELAGKRVRLRFYLTNATLYSFWTKAGDEILGVQQVD